MDWLDDEPREKTPLWYITFSDLMAILVGFFILLFGFSTLESNRFRLLAGSLREAFGTEGSPSPSPPPAGPVAVSIGRAPALPSKAALFERLSRLLKSRNAGPLVEATMDPEGVRVRIDGTTLFASGSAALEPQALPFLDAIAATGIQSGRTIVVEGHTDDVPIHSPIYPSNWELAGARAGAVVRYLAGRNVPAQRLEAVAFADTRPRAPKSTDDGRRKNRRVEILMRTEQ